jgi:hypothetical protein
MLDSKDEKVEAETGRLADSLSSSIPNVTLMAGVLQHHAA